MIDLHNRYLIWQLVAMKRAYTVTRMDDAFLKRRPGSLEGIWPAGAYAVLEDEPGNEEGWLPDSLWNASKRLIISPRLKSFLERAALPDVEYWPLKLMDRTGCPLGEPYYFVHLLNPPDCLDLAASGATRSRAMPTLAEKVARLAFHSDPAKPLCRPSTFAGVTLVSWPLAESLGGHGFSGFRWMGLFDYGIKGDLPPDPRRHKVDALCARLSVS